MNAMHDDSYAYGGARATIELHDRYLREFLATWRRAKSAGVALPETDDTSYASMEALLRHVLRAARGYMTWMCQKLGLPDPDIRPTPEVDTIEADAEAYMEHVLERWRDPLREVAPERFDEEHQARWGVTYCIDGMLEHAVMHPIRHSLQLTRLIK